MSDEHEEKTDVVPDLNTDPEVQPKEWKTKAELEEERKNSQEDL